MTAKRLDKLLQANNDGGLGDIVRHAREMGDLVQCLQRAMDGEDPASIIAANVRDGGELIVLTSSSAWAARLRFNADALIEAARSTGATVSSCRVRVGRE